MSKENCYFLDVFVRLSQTISPTKYIEATTILEQVDIEEDSCAMTIR